MANVIKLNEPNGDMVLESRRATTIDFHTSARDRKNSLRTAMGQIIRKTTTTTTARRPIRRRRKATSKAYTWNHRITLGIWGSRVLLLFVAMVYSTNFASVKYLETLCLSPPCEHDPSEASFCRFVVSAIVCLPLLYSNRQHLGLIKAGVEVGFWSSVNYVCQAEALEYIPAGKCAFIAALSVVTVPIFAGIFLGKRIQTMSIVSAGIALFGVAILENVLPMGRHVATTAPAKAGASVLGIGIGDMLALGQPLGFGYAVMRIEYYVETFSHIPNRVLTMTAAQCVTVCLLSFVWIMIDCSGRFPDLSYMMETHHLIALGWTGIITSVVAIVLQGIALQKASATDAALIFSSEPVWGSLFAGWLLKERLNTTTYIGGFFILLACVLGSLTTSTAATTTTNTNTKKLYRKKSHNSDISPAGSQSSMDDDSLSLLPTTINATIVRRTTETQRKM